MTAIATTRPTTATIVVAPSRERSPDARRRLDRSAGGSTTAPPPTATCLDRRPRLRARRRSRSRAGGSVTWRNGDDRDHTATGRGTAFDTGVLRPGASASERFPTRRHVRLPLRDPPGHGRHRAGRAAGATSGAARGGAQADRRAPPSRRRRRRPRGSSGGAAAPASATGSSTSRSTRRSATVPLGSTVTWTNDGSRPSTPSPRQTDRSTAALLSAGASFVRRTFDRRRDLSRSSARSTRR